MEGNPDGAHQGMVMAIRGSVIDARFPQPLPAPYHVLRAGDQQRISPAVRGRWSLWRTQSKDASKFCTMSSPTIPSAPCI
jgi:hypothetical protein